MSWLYLLVAGALEIVWAVGLKSTEGFTRPLASAVTLVAMAASLWLLALAMRELPVGTAYAVWTGIGAAGTAIVGMAVLGDPVTAGRVASISLIVGGVLGLKFASG